MSTEEINVVETPVVVDPIVRQLDSMSELLDTLSKTSKSLTAEMKSLTKDINKLRLSTQKGKRVKKVVDPDAPRKLGALEKPVPITEELCDFLGLVKGEMYSRHFITKSIYAYVKENELQNPENKRYILLDSEKGLKLKELLREPDQPLTFFNIQRYLKVHYPVVDKPEDSKKKTVKETVKEPEVIVADAGVVADSGVVSDAAVVDETDSEVPKKKVVRKVVKKSVTA
jgi:upstream activation factor subunit UAF30